MKVSRRARRMQQFRQRSRPSGLNLVSLMDIFTILVFFLLVNSSATPQLPNSKDLRLPQSVSQTIPGETLTIAVTLDQILLQGVSVTSVADAMQSPEEVISSLKSELSFAASSFGDDAERIITIAGHEDLDYELIRKLLKTCQDAGFYHVAFAANQVQRSQALVH